MAKYLERTWEPQFASGGGLSRRQEVRGRYLAYLPDPIANRRFIFDSLASADVADAERAITKLDSHASTLANTEALARLLLRAEAVASSRIEGLEISPQRLLKADVARTDGEIPTDATANEVLGNVDAMMYAVRTPESEITVERLLEVHRRLLAPTKQSMYGGVIRKEQNWIGGGSISPIGAAFVPPPPEEVLRLLEDLCSFCNETSLPAVAQAAIAHAQFETIHPFVDGNGRTGRALIFMVFGKRGLVKRTLPPVSLILATRSKEYIAGLTGMRYEGAPDSPAAIEGINTWVEVFAGCCTRAVTDAEAFERQITAIEDQWRDRLPRLRSDASALALVDRLAATPIVTARAVATMLQISAPAANTAIDVLQKAGILVKTRAGRRNRAFEARDIVDAFTALERQLASVDGDTRVSEPVRDVPSRPSR